MYKSFDFPEGCEDFIINKNVLLHGRSYHRGMIVPHKTFGIIKRWQYFYDDSVETLQNLRNML